MEHVFVGGDSVRSVTQKATLLGCGQYAKHSRLALY